MAKRPALGKGMGALLDSAAQTGRGQYFLCPIEELKPHANQPRKHFDGAKMEELVESIRQKGVIQPLVVRREENFYQIIAGERRWRAAQKAGLKEIPVTIQDVSEDWALEIALIENIQREDLNPIEEAEAYAYLVKHFDLSQEEVAKRVGKSRSAVANALRLLRLPEKICTQVITGALSMGHARALLALEHEDEIEEAADRICHNNLSVRETEKLVKKIKNFDHSVEHENPPTVSNPELQKLEDILRKNLGAKVKITTKGQGGKIEISYANPQDLERLLDYLNLV
ncbi:MAG: ParB/RepB/Spo0J family partition protein [Desulfuromonadaceae bacterium]|nr:ParB/RepB/Spo0J family partition protein [Desulfuromonas sp.]MDY0184913.1 ParB/RepB/Spo0J family partition protein [Desulfuromonadaceae bacterium]